MAGFSDTMTLDQFADRLANAPAHVDYTPLLKQIRLVIVAATKENFVGSHAPDGTPWAALKPSTIRGRRKGKAAGTPQPLRDTGVLMASLTGGGAGSYERITDTRLEYGTAVDYAGYQQEGTKTIPPRPFLGISDPMAETIELMVGEFVEKAIGGAL